MSKQDTIISLLKEINENVDNLDTTFVTTDLAITENGLYKPIDYDVEGFNIVDVNVSPTLEEITITENGEYTPQEGVDGFSKVVVEAGSSNKVVLSSLRVQNTDIIDGYWAAELVDVSNVTDLSLTFFSCRNLIFLDLSNWDVSNVKLLSSTFLDCSELEFLNTSNWNTSSLTSISSTFTRCYKLKTIMGIENWDMSNVTYMSSVFSNCGVTELNVNNWDVSKVTRMDSVFSCCTSLQSLDLSNWDVSNTTLNKGMFQECMSLQYLDISTWDVSKNTDLGYMFKSCLSLQSVDVSNWNVSNVTSMTYLFNGCKSLQSIDISRWNVSNVKYALSSFYNCISLTSIIGNRTIEDVLANNICALNGLKCSTSFGGCDNLDCASLRAVINGLADLTGQTTQTLTLGATLMAKLETEDPDSITIATEKGWTLA